MSTETILGTKADRLGDVNNNYKIALQLIGLYEQLLKKGGINGDRVR